MLLENHLLQGFCPWPKMKSLHQIGDKQLESSIGSSAFFLLHSTKASWLFQTSVPFSSKSLFLAEGQGKKSRRSSSLEGLFPFCLVQRTPAALHASVSFRRKISPFLLISVGCFPFPSPSLLSLPLPPFPFPCLPFPVPSPHIFCQAFLLSRESLPVPMQHFWKEERPSPFDCPGKPIIWAILSGLSGTPRKRTDLTFGTSKSIPRVEVQITQQGFFKKKKKAFFGVKKGTSVSASGRSLDFFKILLW